MAKMHDPHGEYVEFNGVDITGHLHEDYYPGIEHIFSDSNLAAGPLTGSLVITQIMRRWRWFPGQWRRTTLFPVSITKPGVLRMSEHGPEYSTDFNVLGELVESWEWQPWYRLKRWVRRHLPSRGSLPLAP